MTKPECFGSRFVFGFDPGGKLGFPVKCEACDSIDDCICAANKADCQRLGATEKGRYLSTELKALCRKKARLHMIERHRDEYEQRAKEFEAKALAIIICENEHGRITW